MNTWALVAADPTKHLIVEGLDTFIKDELVFRETFPNFGDVSITETHPFALIRIAELDGKQFPANVFPCIAVSATLENKFARNILGMRRESADYLTQSKFNEYKNIADQYKLTAKSVEDTIQANLDVSTPMSYAEYEQIFNGTFIFSMWAMNHDVTEFLYFIVKSFLQVHQEDVFINNNWEELNWTADREGIYNFDFGRALYGSSITVTGSRADKYLVVSTDDVARFDDLQTPIEGINSLDGSGSEYSPGFPQQP